METTAMYPLSESEKTEPVIGKEYMINVGRIYDPEWNVFKVVSKAADGKFLIQHLDCECSPMTWSNWVASNDVMNIYSPKEG